MAHGICGAQFHEAFSCFVYSEDEPKGVNCVEKFKAMQDCFKEHPDVYGEGMFIRFPFHDVSCIDSHTTIPSVLEIMEEDEEEAEMPPIQSETDENALPSTSAASNPIAPMILLEETTTDLKSLWSGYKDVGKKYTSRASYLHCHSLSLLNLLLLFIY